MKIFFAAVAAFAAAIYALPAWAEAGDEREVEFAGQQVAITGPANEAALSATASPCGCEQCGREFCEACCELPAFIAHVDAVYLQRERPSSVPIFNDPQGATLLDASNFSFDYRPGIDAGLIRNVGCDWSVELRYFWLDDSRADASFAFPTGVNFVQTNPVSFFDGGSAGGTGTCREQSELQFGELNLRRHFGCVDLLGGFRCVAFDDRLSGLYTFTGLPGVETQSWTAKNTLYGGQIGADAALWEGSRGLQIHASGSAGVYDNQVQTRFLTDFIAGNSAWANAADNHVALVGEIGITATYPITCHVALRGGYRMLWLDGVAVAGKQVPATGNINYPGVKTSYVDAASTVFYQGFSGGLEITW